MSYLSAAQDPEEAVALAVSDFTPVAGEGEGGAG